MPPTFSGLFASSKIAGVFLSLLAFSLPAAAQTQTEVKVETKPVTPGGKPVTTTVTTETALPGGSNIGVAFTEMGKGIASQPVKLPAGAVKVRQLSAPLLGSGGQTTVLLNFYQRNGVFFADIRTSKSRQPWTKRNQLRLSSSLGVSPGAATAATLRYIDPQRRRGFTIVASDGAKGHLVMTFPKGFGGPAGQQAFLTTAKDGTQTSYTFSDLDGRGLSAIKASVESVGQVQASEQQQFFVWNGTRFIPRRKN